MTEKELLEGLRNQDTAAFKEIFFTYYSDLHFYCYSIIKNESEVEDIVAPVLYKLWENAMAFDSIEGVRAYLFVAVKNSSINFLRKNTTHATHLEKIKSESPDSQEADVSKSLDYKTVKKIVWAAAQDLPTQCREVFILITFKNHTVSETAQEIGISDHQVHVQYSRAKKQIRETLKEKGYNLNIAILLILIGL